MNAREERGLIIAALCKLNRTDDGWLVPSQSGEKVYTVNVEKQTCTCPDHQEAGFKCKHIYAVEFTVKREVLPDGTVIDTKSITFTEKVAYKQNWPAYNMAQSIEKDRLQELLADLCKGLPEPERKGCGRKPHLVRDAIFALVFKVYCTMSSRRTSSEPLGLEAQLAGKLGAALMNSNCGDREKLNYYMTSGATYADGVPWK